jgi:hypothetical protein
MRRTPWPILITALAALLAGCRAASDSTELTLTAAQYPAAFEAAKDALVASHFELERVDAGSGVITTVAKPSSGLATPWDTEQTTLEQEWEDLLNRQQRRVRVTFEPVQATDGGAAADLRDATGPIVGRVEVTIDRVHRPGWRLETTSLRFSSFSSDPDLVARGMWPRYTVPVSQDPLLAARLTERIRERLDSDAPAAPAKP